MKKTVLLLLYLSCAIFARTQTLSDPLKEQLSSYFITLPESNDFHGWIDSIQKDSAVIIDTIINKDFYFYFSFDSKYFISPIDSKRKMVIMARNKSEVLSKEKIFLLIQMEYYGDTLTNGRLNVQNAYKVLCEKFKPYFTFNWEQPSDKKKSSYRMNSFYLEKQSLPVLTIQQGKYYKDKSNCLILSLYFELKKDTDASFWKDGMLQ